MGLLRFCNSPILITERSVFMFGSVFRKKGTEPTPLVRVLKKNIVMFVALAAALVTVFLVPPDKKYLGYFDFKTLTCLFCVLAVVCALKNIQFL
jgi:peptidoglycan/LPS O-acetylase OafA/YrhL